MKPVWVRVVAGLSLLAGAGVALVALVSFSACVHDDSTLFIRDELAPQPGGSCVYTSDPTQVFISSGTLDLSLRLQYDGAFLVGNQMVAQANSSQLQTETSNVTIQGAVVRITDRNSNQIGTFTRLTSATIPPAAGNTPGYSPVFVTILDPATILSDPEIRDGLLAQPLGQPGYVRLITYVRFFGHSLGGQSLESNEFEFPVDVCNGCLIDFSNNPNFPVPNCVANVASGTSTSQTQLPCFVGQDVSVDCNACQGNDAACRGSFQVPPGLLDAGSG